MTYPVNKPLRLLLVGATGAVGRQVLALALVDPRIEQVIAPTRRPLPNHAKLYNPVIDFTHLPVSATWWKVDAVICTLGTTIKAAGSQAAFAAVDRDLPIQVAKLAKAAGATRFALNSSLGANPAGNFYLRTKAEAEAGIRNINYPSFTIVRPSLIDAVRDESRMGERIGLIIAQIFRPLIPLRYQAVKAECIALALLDGVLKGQSGECIIESEQLQNKKTSNEE
ncbi:MAG: NAD(P)H-binding protein [Methylobacter sp.]|uniref:NAD(P)H-binding protein n=1 Tax=Methylobacter sp. TaxID=2051955 RepID=UPI0025EA4D88|nr:NAD(P)H-binding protein [Methylobacter sp.]MCK9622952.1 NAD(P)H-binding protein [Methylobacter sp.]